jgi:hypothetical protein
MRPAPQSYVVGARSWYWCLFVCLLCGLLQAQTDSNERSFPQSKLEIEKALKSMQATMSGRLPVLDGFAKPATHPLEQYQRAFYQAAAEVSSSPSGGSLVRINTKITAWYADPVPSHAGYQLLASNGRIESDILDQLATQLSSVSPIPEAHTTPPAKEAASSAPIPTHNYPDLKGSFPSSSSSLQEIASAAHPANSVSATASPAPKKPNPLQAEADSLEEILKNTAHPKNLVAVKKSGTPVVAAPSLKAKPEFLASQHDEFELLDFNADWVHVRISGLSRGWIWRNSVEMPEGIPDTAANAAAPATASDLFRVTRDEVGQFPGDWAPLRGKNVKIVTVQNTNEHAKDTGPQDRIEYTKFLLEKSLPDMLNKAAALEGIVVIFDSPDGGMIAATTAVLQQWKAGKWSDAALWHRCFFDPPETFDSAADSTGSSGAGAQQ